DRVDRPALRAETGRVTALASIAVGEALLILKILFLLLLYLFIWRLVVPASPSREVGETHLLDSTLVRIGRGGQNDIALDDDFASANHARIEPRRDGVWVSDAGSTNGTFVNGARLQKPLRLTPGDVIRVGSTDLRFES